MRHLLVVSDDWAKKKSLKSQLLDRGFSVTVRSSGEAIQDDGVPSKPLDVILVDLERCQSDGASLCRALKYSPPLKELPLIALLTEEQLGQVDYLRAGVDDYLTLPVSVTRLVQRIHFLLWKLHRIEQPRDMSLGGLTIDVERDEVRVHGEPVDLTYKEFELLKFLATHPGKPFTREVLLNKVWGYDYYGGTRTIDVHIRRLRSKIEVGGSTYIETVRNVGYKFIGPSPGASGEAHVRG